ncbi:TraH family protein [Pseudaminobacter salicylatoxidans]|uniref:TraH protein n=1 Tax=Pseudaminobacter salicylatoxidans TaxID=93369 RepID=A0A316C6K5_PSESE|nr:TraH family protein [Pseudaminobacter salicylatoxidans]PWJ73373.1 TraH protein [Pseudaminobacter salicylatoxidans]
MIDAALIQQCADPRLSVEIVQKFVEEVGAADHLTVTVKSGQRTFAVPKPATAEEALALTQQHVGQAVVRVGLTQYPAGLGVADKSELSIDLFDPCENLRRGTALFGKVYRIVTKWYGNPRPEAFDDAIWAYGTGIFEGERVFYADDPEDVKVAEPEAAEAQEAEGEQSAETEVGEGPSEPPFKDEDPNKASIRIDLSGIKSHNTEPKTAGQ